MGGSDPVGLEISRLQSIHLLSINYWTPQIDFGTQVNGASLIQA
jgi:hypothetical protein